MAVLCFTWYVIGGAPCFFLYIWSVVFKFPPVINKFGFPCRFLQRLIKCVKLVLVDDIYIYIHIYIYIINTTLTMLPVLSVCRPAMPEIFAKPPSVHPTYNLHGSFCVCAQPMGNHVILHHRLSLVGRIHKMIPESGVQGAEAKYVHW